MLTRLTKIIGTSIATLVLVPVVIYAAEGLLGYYPGETGWRVAKMAAEQKDPELCERIIRVPWPILVPGPSVASHVVGCIQEYAALAKDPSVCERLMPSSYGLDCVGGALGNAEACPLGTDRNVSINNVAVSLADCVRGTPDLRDHPCCKTAKARFLAGYSDCSMGGATRARDQCYYELAFKDHDPTPCVQITDEKLRSACQISANALRQDPSICEGCTQPVERIEDLSGPE